MNLGNLLGGLGDHVRWRRLGRHDVLFRRGDAATAMFAVGHGRVRLVREEQGTEVIQHVARAGDTLAEAALFSRTYHCDALAEVPSRIAVIPREILLQRIERDPVLLRELLAGLAEQVQDARRRLWLRSVRPARERVWQYLLLTSRGRKVDVDRPMRDVASEIGLTPEALYRALAGLKADGRVTGRGRELRIHPGNPRKT